MAKRKSAAEAVEPTPLQDAVPRTAESAPVAEDPDVSEQKQVLISPGPDGARLRLLRSRRYNHYAESSIM